MNFRSTRIASVGVGVLLLSAAFAGCGGSDDSEAISQEDFIAQADQICADYKIAADEALTEFQPLLDSGDLEGAADIFEETSNGINTSLDDIVALGVPEGDEETIDEWIALGREQAAIGGDIADAIRLDDGPTIEAGLEEGDAIQVEADAIADEYGMIDCGSAGNDS